MAMTNKVSTIKGPPGTGKSLTIVKLIETIRKLEPEKTIAVATSNKGALESIFEKLKEYDINYIYIGNKKELGEQRNNPKINKFLSEFVSKEDKNKKECLISNSNEFLKEFPLIINKIDSLTKTFKDKEDVKFDYVIVDECSQVDLIRGLIVMDCARQLVLVGDQEQLPPVFVNDNYKIRGTNKNINSLHINIPEKYYLKEGKSFLSITKDIFDLSEDNGSEVMLKEHYRCHPGIIGYCNKEIYNGKLVVKTKINDDYPKELVPIRVRWYEGEYSEKPLDEYWKLKNNQDISHESHKGTDGKYVNVKQIQVFLKDEWLTLKQRLIEDDELTACIISPYNRQLRVLKEFLPKGEFDYDFVDETKNISNEDDEDGHSIKSDVMLSIIPKGRTIHKSQGSEFDIVCYMSVQDEYYDTSWPWSQQRNLINVAVSRAKKEFCVITSSNWFNQFDRKKFYEGEDMKFLDYHPVKDEAISGGQTKEKDTSCGDLYIKRLLQYVYDNYDYEYDKKKEFGFKKTTISSWFDNVMKFREEIYENSQKFGTREQRFAFEECAKAELENLVNKRESYSIKTQVELLSIAKDLGKECKDCVQEDKYLDIRKSSVDFVIYKDDKPVLVVEIDGDYHRTNRDKRNENEVLNSRPQFEGDEDKDKFFKDILKGRLREKFGKRPFRRCKRYFVKITY